MTPWTIPRDWEGETCAILASGPSMSLAVANSVRGRCRVIAVNNQGIPTVDNKKQRAPALAPWADVLYAADRLWWHHNREAALKFAGLKLTMKPAHDRELNAVDGVHVIGNGGPTGFDDRQDHIRTGSNSGYQAVHVAAHFGAKRILLCGFDMNSKKGEHWHGDHRWRPGHASMYPVFLKAFEVGAPEFAARGIEIINCTRDSSLKCFPFMTLEEALHGVQTVREGEGDIAGTDRPLARTSRGIEIGREAAQAPAGGL